MGFRLEEEHDSRSHSSDWSCLDNDLTELILSYLPLRSIVRARLVCKLWNSLIAQESFASRVSRKKKPWFFLFGQNNVFLKNNQAFGFDPESKEWIRLSSSLFPRPLRQEDSFIGSSGFFFLTTGSTLSQFRYTPLLSDSWQFTQPLRFSRSNPLVGVFEIGGSLRFIVAGGARFIGGLVDIEERLAVEIYDCQSDSWVLCPPLPAHFRPGNSSQCLCSTLLNGKFFVFGIHSGFVSAFDLNQHLWSAVRVLKPPGVIFSFLVSCQNQLILAGLCNNSEGPSFNLWRVDEGSMVFTDLAVMPRDLLSCLIESDEDEKFASLKCVGLGNLIYVFNEEHHRVYPACACEISPDLGCTWWRVPELPPPVNKFHKVIGFCSKVPLNGILGHGPKSWLL
ncbi:F-box/kelch-repeat protein [Nymphaea thermarum]|nr:F-box/kelch-repeat protein [Nymphaea thermarum]